MKNVRAVILVSMAFVQAEAQTGTAFMKRYVARLEDNLTNIHADWISMDADTLLDVVVTGTAADGHTVILPYKNVHAPSYFEKKPTLPTGMKVGYTHVADWNRDGRMDLLIAARTIVNTDAIFVFTGNGNSGFQKQTEKILEYAGPFVVADFNSDGMSDILTYGTQFIRIYKISGTTATQVYEANGITPTTIAVCDINNSGMSDFVVTGHDQQNKPVTSVFYGEGNFKFTRQNVAGAIDGALSLADVNADGLFDVVVAGSTSGAIMINRGDTLVQERTFDGSPNASLFSGDMTSDGNTDFLLSGKRVNYIRELSEVITDLDTTGLILQRMGDRDGDGDLDLFQVIDSVGSQWIRFYENTSARNNRPARPDAGFAISAGNKTFIIWQPATDDLTAAASLTYDVWLGINQSNVLMPSFSLVNKRRAAVRHGNAGTNTSMIVHGAADGRYSFLIQSIDNAYNGSYGVCSGSVLPCSDLVYNDVQACRNTEVTLGGGERAWWFSVSNGPLGETDELRFTATVNDTLFALVPQQGDCSKNKVYVVHVNDALSSGKQTIHSCKDRTITLAIAPGWEEIAWDVTPAIYNTPAISYIVGAADTVTATAKSAGCTYKKQFFIRISEPTVTIPGDGFQVLKGTPVQLEARGNAATWKWDPPDGLSNSTIASPTATPLVTTQYIVTGTDSVGCTNTARITVRITETAFVPTLFTPNDDGRNDNLVVYGLTMASRFRFSIFNREGILVYETKDVGEASTVGWNGFVRGTRQPGGLYYWKVEGEMPNGDKLLLNGKSTGSVLLVH